MGGAAVPALLSGVVFAAFIIPVFAFRHWVQDGGKFPAHAMEELGLKEGERGERRAGMLPYLALVLGVVVVLVANWYFVLPGTERMGFVDYLLQPIAWFKAS